MTIKGKKLIITPSTFDEATDLKDAVENAIKEGRLCIDIKDSSIDNLSLDSITPDSFTSLLNVILTLDSGKRVRQCLFVCAERAVLGEDKIDKDFFETVENREYYYKIMLEVLKVNLFPFFKGLSLKLKDLGIWGMIKNILKQK